jgi:hypothetical protein
MEFFPDGTRTPSPDLVGLATTLDGTTIAGPSPSPTSVHLLADATDVDADSDTEFWDACWTLEDETYWATETHWNEMNQRTAETYPTTETPGYALR